MRTNLRCTLFTVCLAMAHFSFAASVEEADGAAAGAPPVATKRPVLPDATTPPYTKGYDAFLAEYDFPDDSRRYLSQTLDGYTAEDSEQILGWAAFFIDKEASNRDKQQILVNVVMPVSQRADVLEKAASIITDKMSGIQKTEILCAMHRTSPDEHDSVLAHVHAILRHAKEAGVNTEDGKDTHCLIYQLNRIPADQRHSIITYAHTLMASLQVWHILPDIYKIPADQRDDVLAHAKTFVTDEMTGSEIGDIISMIAPFPADERRDVVAHAHNIFKMQDVASFHKTIHDEDVRKDLPRESLMLGPHGVEIIPHVQFSAGGVADAISAGLDYPGISPLHCFLKDTKRARYTAASDEEALNAYQVITKHENLNPSLEPSHAFAEAIKIAPKMSRDTIIIVNSCGDAHKDKDILKQRLGKYK